MRDRIGAISEIGVIGAIGKGITLITLITPTKKQKQTHASLLFCYNPVIFLISLSLLSASRGVSEFISSPLI